MKPEWVTDEVKRAYVLFNRFNVRPGDDLVDVYRIVNLKMLVDVYGHLPSKHLKPTRDSPLWCPV